jgi:hypothetical protein
VSAQAVTRAPDGATASLIEQTKTTIAESEAWLAETLAKPDLTPDELEEIEWTKKQVARERRRLMQLANGKGEPHANCD